MRTKKAAHFATRASQTSCRRTSGTHGTTSHVRAITPVTSSNSGIFFKTIPCINKTITTIVAIRNPAVVVGVVARA